MQNNTIFGDSKASSLIVLDNVSSTNDYLKNILTNFKPQLPFTAIMARHQTEGRGQRGNDWISEANTNLTISYLCTPSNLTTKDQFILTIISSLAVYEAIHSSIKGETSIKWPNDIMVNNKKIGGILIENKVSSNSIKNSIIGIGINVYSVQFPESIAHKVTSLKLENFDFNLTIVEIALQIKKNLMHYESIFNQNGSAELRELYRSRLFQKDILSKYITDNKEIEGIIKGVDEDGRLILLTNNETIKYDLKGISYQI